MVGVHALPLWSSWAAACRATAGSWRSWRWAGESPPRSWSADALGSLAGWRPLWQPRRWETSTCGCKWDTQACRPWHYQGATVRRVKDWYTIFITVSYKVIKICEALEVSFPLRQSVTWHTLSVCCFPASSILLFAKLDQVHVHVSAREIIINTGQELSVRWANTWHLQEIIACLMCPRGQLPVMDRPPTQS